MAETQPNAKPAKKPSGHLETGKVAQGMEKAPESKSEVAGHMSYGGYYTCWHCGSINFVPAGWTSFYCRIDYVLNVV